jgi:4-alpha-glucanotransferase
VTRAPKPPRAKANFRLDQRASGILLHMTSLPGPHGSGDLGPDAYRFVDFLAAAGQRWWQMLPIGPPGPGNGPYSARSAFAGSPWLVSLQRLADDGLLQRKHLVPSTAFRPDRVRYPALMAFRLARLRRAFAEFESAGGTQQPEFLRFTEEQRDWLDDYALFAVLRSTGRHALWTKWKPGLRRRRTSVLRAAERNHARNLRFERFIQYEWARQWTALRRYARDHGVALMGDIPIFVSHDSADVWAHPDLFDLEHDGRPRTISGVPPDMFSRTGQLWGHPQYCWPQHRATRFAWWLARFRRTFELFDAVRIDHFLGFSRVWTVPGRARTAKHGRWVATPGAALFNALCRTLGRPQIIAEDLGIATPAALALRDRYAWPGMRLLHFAFEHDGRHYNEPDAFPRTCVVYPGTHDNETTVGWFRHVRARARSQRARDGLSQYDRVLRYLGTTGHEINWDIIRLALMSVASLAIIPAQDLLGLGNEARMNVPATPTGNWEWRLRPGALTKTIAQRLRDLTVAYDRLRVSSPPAPTRR